MEYNLCPKPKKALFEDEFLQLSDELVHQINNYTLSQPDPRGIRRIEGANPISTDWYKIVIGQAGVIVFSGSDSGYFYAIKTLKQLISQSGMLPLCMIEDSPDFSVRSVMLDISRDRVPKIETLFTLIDYLADWKINQFQLYTEHTYTYKDHEDVWKDASPMTADDIEKLKKYLSDRCIELVPNQNSFGHLERWLKHEDYHHLAECPDGFEDSWGIFRPESSTLSPAIPETLNFLDSLYEELLPQFDSEYLNVGGDEPWELGKGRSKELCDEKGLPQVYIDFLMKIKTLAEKKGKKIQIYGDIIMNYPEIVKQLPKDIILINWGYEANHPFEKECPIIAKAGIPFYVCLGTSAWNSLGGRWSNTWKNVLKGASEAKKHGAQGLMVSEWGDNGHWQQFPIALPGFLLSASAAWNVDSLSSFDPIRSFTKHIFKEEPLLAKVMMNVQNVWEMAGKPMHNVSLAPILMADPCYPYYREEYKNYRGHQFIEELTLLNKSKTILTRCKNSIFKDELSLTVDLLIHGCNLGRHQLSTPNLLIKEIDKGALNELINELEPLIDFYKKIWVERCRIGGLKDSAGRFETLLEWYEDAVSSK